MNTIREAWRSFRSARSTSGFALLILTAAMAATTITFSVVDGIVLRSLAFEDSDQLVIIGPQNRTYSPAEYFAWRDRSDAFVTLAATNVGPMAHVPSDTGVSYVRAWETSASLFEVLRVRALLGQVFTSANEIAGQHLVAVISHEVWQRYFGADPHIVGRSIRMGDRRRSEQPADLFEIVGVMPKGFMYPMHKGRPQVWIPLVLEGSRQGQSGAEVIGRVRSGVKLADAQSQISAIHAAVAAAEGRPRREDRRPVLVLLHDSLVEHVRDWMLLVLCAVSLVMLVACFSVANLMLAQTSRRRRELAVRASLGASPGQLAAALAAEGLMLSVTAAVMAIAVAWWGLGATKAALPAGIPRVEDIAVDFRVILVTLIAAIVSAVIFTIVPVWQAARLRPGELLSYGAMTAAPMRPRWRATLVTMEVSFVSALLVVSTLFVGSFVRLVRTDLGFARSNVATFELGNVQGRTAQVIEALETTPGVISVAELSSVPPLVQEAYGGTETRMRIRAAGSPDDALAVTATTYLVSPAYFETAGIQMLRGRTFAESDFPRSVAIIDELAARVLFADGRDPIGARISLTASRPPLTVIGIVRTVSPHGPEQAPGTQLYLPRRVDAGETSQIVVRTSGRASSVVPALRTSLARVLPAGTPPPTVRSLQDAFRAITAGRRANAGIMTAFGIVVLLIGASGVYAVMASSVAQQHHELAVRIALGATGGRVARGVLTRATAYLLVGLVVGSLIGRALSAVFASLLFQVQPSDVSVYATVTVLLLSSGLTAAALPAIRAARIDPIIALRTE